MSNIVNFQEALLAKRDAEFEKRQVLDRDFVAALLKQQQKHDPELDAKLCKLAWEDRNS